jgi:hypothetical protein
VEGVPARADVDNEHVFCVLLRVLVTGQEMNSMAFSPQANYTD